MAKFQTYHLSGMSCTACAQSAQKVLSKTAEVQLVRVNYATQTATILFENDKTLPLEDLNKRIAKLGFQLSDLVNPWETQQQIHEAENAKIKALKNKLLYSTFLAIPLIIIGMIFHHAHWANTAMFLLATPLMIIAGKDFYISAWRQLKAKTSNMDTLVALGASVAYCYSVFNYFLPQYFQDLGLSSYVYFEAAGGLLFFILLGKFMEAKAKGKTHAALDTLLALQKDIANIFVNNTWQIVPLNMVQINDICLVAAGEYIPVDGTIVQGQGECIESMLTGEPLPIAKQIGDKVYAGTNLIQGTLQIRVETLPTETALMQIVKMVQNAQSTNILIQKTVDKVAAIFVPSIIIIALMVFMIWGIFLHNWAQAFVALMSILVVACPCALGLATPTALMVGIGAAAQKGILIKGANALEIGSQIKHLIVDKTGTLTEGKPQVINIYSMPYSLSQKNKNILYAIQAQSNHPIGKAIAQHFQNQGAEIVGVEYVNPLVGKGIMASFENENFYMGSLQWLESLNYNFSAEAKAWNLAQMQNAYSVIWAANDKDLLMGFALGDKIRTEAKEAIHTLQNEYKMQIHLCTGDQWATAQEVAKKLQINDIYAQAQPVDKLDLVIKLQAQNRGKVAMLGDGINDAAALAKSDLGIAVHSSIQVAADSADVVLLYGDLQALTALFAILKKTKNIIYQNLFWAFAYNVLMIPFAAGVFLNFGWELTPMMAGAAMAISSVTVVLNSLRLHVFAQKK